MTGAELRASILQAAVQGKLVPQDATDEPASVLLGRIRAERAELVRQKKAKTPKGGESIITRYPDGTVWEQRGKGKAVEITDEIPFDIPDGWEWARLGSALDVRDGTHATPKYVSEGYPLVTSKNIRDGKIDFSTCKLIAEKDYREISARSNVQRNDIIMAMIGTIGNPVIVDTDVPFSIKNVALFKRVPNGCDMHYAHSFLRYAQSVMKKESSGGVQSFVSLSYLRDFLMPIPPLAEQRRIVAKLDELMPLVERYDRLDHERSELNADIAAEMRASVLQAAVQGALTEREPDDEPAIELLECRGKKPLWVDDVPFDLPNGWCWSTLGDIATLERGAGIKRGEVTETGMPCVRYGELYTTYDQAIAEIQSHTTEDIFDRSHHLEPDEVLMTLTGENDIDIGRAVVNLTGDTVAYGGDLLALKNHCMDGRFLMFMVNSDYVREQRTAAASGKIIVHLSGKKVSQFIVAVPPLAEQRRIVAKLDEMLPKVERLGGLT